MTHHTPFFSDHDDEEQDENDQTVVGYAFDVADSVKNAEKN